MENKQETYQDLEKSYPQHDLPGVLGVKGVDGYTPTSTYFTPSIEDIRVGYECEAYHEYYTLQNDEYIFKQEWNKPIITWKNIMLYSSEVLKNRIRVSYLTKEQIEKEGWEARGGKGYYYKDKYQAISIHQDDGIMFFAIIRYLKSRAEYEVLFKGECKDINTFRYICKLLGI